MEPRNDGQRATIDAALALFDRQPPAAYFPSSRAIAVEAHCARNTLANRFGGGSHHSVLRHLASSYSLTTPEWEQSISKLLHELEATTRTFALMQPEGPPAAIAGLAREHMSDNFSDRLGFRRQLAFTLAATTDLVGTDDVEVEEDEIDRAEFASCLASEYGALADSYIPLYERLLTEWGRSLRRPINMRSFAMGLTALTEGLLLRELADESVSREEVVDTFGQFVHALLVMMTADTGDERSVDEACADAVRRQTAAPTRARKSSEVVGSASSRSRA